MKDRRSKDDNLRVRQARMAVLCAEMKSSQEVADIISEEFNIKETRDNVYAYSVSKHGKRLIASLHKEFLSNLAKIPIANKAIRLARLDKVYEQSMTESLKSINQYGEVYELKLGAAVEALKAAREEIEGNKPLIDASQHYHFTSIKEAIENVSKESGNRVLENKESSGELEKQS